MPFPYRGDLPRDAGHQRLCNQWNGVGNVLDDLSHYSTGAVSDPGTNDVINGYGGFDLIYIHSGNDTVTAATATTASTTGAAATT